MAAVLISRRVLVVAALFIAAGCVQDQLINRSDDSRQTGMKLFAEGQYADAAGAFQKSVREDPRQYKSYYQLGACYDQMGQYQQAIQAYKSGIDVMSTSLEGKEDKPFRMKLIDAAANSISKSSNRGQELDALQQRASGKQSAIDYLMLAKVYRYAGDADSAVDTYNHAALLAPGDFYVQKDAGLYFEKLGQDKQAETPLRKAYALNPADAEVIEALRRIGVVPGPSIKEQKELAKPVVPEGPIPEIKLGGGGDSNRSPAPTQAPESQSPRD